MKNKIVITNPRLILVGDKRTTQIELFKNARPAQIKRIVEKLLLSKSIIAEVQIGK